MNIIYMIFILIPTITLIISIYNFIKGSATLTYRSISLKKDIILTGKDARKFSAINILGSLIIIISLLLKPIFNINLGYWMLIFCLIGLLLYLIAFFVVDLNTQE